MTRFIMANRRAGLFSDSEKIASRAAVATALNSPMMAGADLIQDNDPVDMTARQVVVFEADPKEVAVRALTLPSDVIVEPEILHYPRAYRPLDFMSVEETQLAAPVLFGNLVTLRANVNGSGVPLLGAEVHLFLRGSGGLSRELQGVTDDNGWVEFQYSELFSPSALVVLPSGGFWPVIVRGPGNPAQITCPALPDAETNLGWWHKLFGISSFDPKRGEGIRVGVIDTGAGPHPNLAHVNNIGAFIGGNSDPLGGADVESHGSHVCGTIGARPVNGIEFAGLAPCAELFVARVFTKGQGANQGDIVNAIDALSRNSGVDLINMSLGAPTASQIEHDAIIDAVQRGTLCICAAANSSGPVEFPAAFPEAVAVSAIGQLGWGPPGTLSAGRVPIERDRFGDKNLYLANFSCFGPEIDCAGPGVGIIASVPARFNLAAPYGAMDGTSMASPSVCGALAAILSMSNSYKALGRNEMRSAEARRLLRASCRTIGMDARYEGFGMPTIG
jgi:subtilisin family serine protease